MKFFLLMSFLIVTPAEKKEFFFKVPMANANDCMEEMEKINDLTFGLGEYTVQVNGSCLIENPQKGDKV